MPSQPFRLQLKFLEGKSEQEQAAIKRNFIQHLPESKVVIQFVNRNIFQRLYQSTEAFGFWVYTKFIHNQEAKQMKKWLQVCPPSPDDE